MKLLHKQEISLRLLSDGELYRQAKTFVREYPPVENSQMAGLLEYSRSWDELHDFVKHQKDDRNWGEPGKSEKAHYHDFYKALYVQLNTLRRDVKEKYNFVSADLPESPKEQSIFFAGLLAREFIQHLAAEMMWKKEVRQ